MKEPIEIGPTTALSDAEAAAAIGVETRAVTSFRAGHGDWRLMRAGLNKVALGLGVQPEVAKRMVAISKRRAYGRRNSEWGSNS